MAGKDENRQPKDDDVEDLAERAGPHDEAPDIDDALASTGGSATGRVGGVRRKDEPAAKG